MKKDATTARSAGRDGVMAMKEIDQFVEFFKQHGVPHERWNEENCVHADGAGVEILTIAQAHLHFTMDGKFIGVDDDEMGCYQRRKV